MKRLICCFDGTWNTPEKLQQAAEDTSKNSKGRDITNVVRIARAILPVADGTPQITFYDEGVGTGGFLDRFMGGTSGSGLDRNAKDGYRFLAQNYQAGDEIYLFGFSRGAFTARRLAGMLGWSGRLLARGELKHLPELYQAFKDAHRQNQKRDKTAKKRKGDILGESPPSIPLNLACVGVWDTVGALGIPLTLFRKRNLKHYQFNDNVIGKDVKVALHALAIDEKRRPFAATMWRAPAGGTAASQIVEQTWFPGVHTTIGGGLQKTRKLANLSLKWMTEKVEKYTDLRFDSDYLDETAPGDIDKNYDHPFADSRSAKYPISKLVPSYRMIRSKPVPQKGVGRFVVRLIPWLNPATSKPRDEGVEIVNEIIHKSAQWRFLNVPLYQPENLRLALEDEDSAP